MKKYKIIIILVLVASSSIFAQKHKNPRVKLSKKEMDEKAIQLINAFQQIGKPTCYSSVTNMKDWVFHNQPILPKQWLKVLQVRNATTSCKKNNYSANIILGVTTKKDTIRIINYCAKPLEKLTNEILIESTSAPTEDYDIAIEWMEEISLDGTRASFLDEDGYDYMIKNTYYAKIVATR